MVQNHKVYVIIEEISDKLFMQLELDLNSILGGFQLDPSANPLLATWRLFLSGGWIVVTIMFIYGAYIVWLTKRQEAFEIASNPILLAIDVPKDNEQSLKAVEQIFAHIHGVESGPNKWEQYFLGEFQLPLSFEIVSIEGHIQYLVHATETYRNVIEAAVYAQYPEAHIAQVEDYTKNINLRFPNKEYRIYGMEFVLGKDQVYPIRTYNNFEHTITQKSIDPMAALLETFSGLGPGEQLWIQFVATPVNDGWIGAGMKTVKKIVKAKEEIQKSGLDKLLEKPIDFLWEVGQHIVKSEIGPEKAGGMDAPSIMQHLTPGERVTVEAIEMKIAKLGYSTKFRFVYLAKTEVFSKPKGVIPIIGAIKQFNTLNLNYWRPYKKSKTKVDYFKKLREPTRQNKLLRAYKGRSQSRGSGGGKILNIEELASMWHFPSIDVKAPLIQKTSAKRAEPPSELPAEIGGGQSALRAVLDGLDESSEEAKTPDSSGGDQGAPPDNLPVG